jgi:alkylhydroperoxidase family enzyme
VTERPWSLIGADLVRARGAGLDDAGVLHAILQASLFGHLNRIADAVDVPADYPDTFGAPRVEPATPPYLAPGPAEVPDPRAPQPVELASRAGAVELLAAWRSHALERDAPPLTRRERAVIAHATAVRLGDLSVEPAPPETDLEHALVELADVVTLAPWRLAPAAYERIRAAGLADDAQVFDAVATASSCTVFSRIAASLAALAR